ncbi:S-4TM family putative pore-forming effector [Chitinophaga sp. CF418]|uniref:S-4TM family putative pore-forming effector n=1 Tax=Chitinophaga sp. CF418 TaxID=1855287 RepID=UPI0009112715|nr:S-4TM family putative pore-forming effector [Chitinophaga sp. CF418]SHN24974.1 hypothetical protein SAMN05216311_107297 [Chitinophaga sp. CF418]
MNNIKELQNRPENIRLLAAQRQLYIKAKNAFAVQVVLTVLSVVVLNFLKLIPQEKIPFDTAWFALLASVVAIIDLSVFIGYISNMRTRAAKIQELFDCRIYGLQWNKFNAGSQPEKTDIKNNADQYRPNPYSPLKDWYNIDLDGLPQESAIIVCQEINLYYDGRLREKFKQHCIWALVGLGGLSVLIGFSGELTVPIFFKDLVAPLLPALALTIKVYTENVKSVKASSELKMAVNTFRQNNAVPTIEQLRQIQDKIYCSRKDSALVPEWFYNKKRKGLEEDMRVTAGRDQ